MEDELSYEDWIEITDEYIDGDQVRDILASWKVERDRLRAALGAEHDVLTTVITARKGSIGNIDNTYLPQVERDRADVAYRLGKAALA